MPNSDQLRKELDYLRKAIGDRLDKFEAKINALEGTKQANLDVSKSVEEAKSEVNTLRKELVADKVPAPIKKLPTQVSPQRKPVKKAVVKPKAPRKPSKLSLAIGSAREQIAEHFFGPITGFVKRTYNHYKQENKLPVFFMTIGGIAAILFGVGYLLQYTYSTVFIDLPEELRISTGFGFSFLIGGTGVYLYRKKEAFREFGSALVSLALIINYLIIYFLTSVLSFSLVGYGLIIVNTALALFSSIRLQTRVIATLTLIGGVLCPFFVEQDVNTTGYFIYLWALSIGLVWVARKIKWKLLIDLVIATGLIVLESQFLFFGSSFNAFTGTLIIHVFAYTYIGILILDTASIFKSDLSARGVRWIVSVFFALSVCVFQAFDYNYTSVFLACVYGGNAVLFSVISLIARNKVSKRFWVLLLSIAASFSALAGIVLLDGKYINVFLGIEAVILLYLGLAYKSSIIRKEAFFILMGGLLQTAYCFDGVFNWYSGFDWFNVIYSLIGMSMVFGAMLFLPQLMAKKRFYVKRLLLTEKTFFRIYHDGFNVLFTFAIAIPVTYLLTDWIAVFLLLTALFLLKVNELKTKFISAYWDKVVLGVAVLFSVSQSVVTAFESSSWLTSQSSLALALFTIILIVITFFSKKQDKVIQTVFRSLTVFFVAFTLSYGLSDLIGVYVSIVIPAFGVVALVIGTRWKEPIVQLLGFGMLVTLFVAVVLSIEETHGFHVSSFPWFGKIAIAEIGVLLFGLLYLNTTILKVKSFHKPFDVLRLLFYIIVPIALISSCNRHYPEFLAYALWAGAAIAFALNKITKRFTLAIQYYVLVGVSIIGSFVELEPALFIVGIGLMAAVFAIQKSYLKTYARILIWRINAYVLSFYLGISLMLGVALWSEGLSALYVGSTYFLALVLLRKYIRPIRTSPSIYFNLGLVILGLGTVFQVSFDGYFVSSEWVASVLQLVSVSMLSVIVYQKKTLFMLKRHHTWWTAAFVVSQVYITLVGASIFILFLDQSFSTVFTVFMVLHALVLLFHTFKERYRFVRFIHLPMFAFILLKLIFFDMNDFSIIQKVMVLIGSGLILLLGSFLFLKLKEKYSDEVKPLEDKEEVE